MHACIKHIPQALLSQKEKKQQILVNYISHYSDSSVLENHNVLQNWPLNNNIKKIVHHAYKQPIALARN
ncbi:19942_t:CDS:2, partial [Cetraspora pellucida]